MKAYLKGTSIALEVRNYWNSYNEHKAPCLMCDCYVSAYDCVESIPAARIEIK